jgi:integrase
VFLTHGQLAELADTAGRWRLPVLVLGYTGLRRGEATALRVCDIDFTHRRIDVRRAFSDVGGKIVLGTPESHLARTVPLPRFLATELVASVQDKNPDGLVFTTVSGSVVRSANWRQKVFLPARKQAEISDRFRIHDLRHTAAALMIQAGYPPRCCKRSSATPAARPRWTCTGTCIPATWTSTPTAWTTPLLPLVRPK